MLLENPDCTGAEARLLDCPMADDLNQYSEYGLYYVTGTCTPGRANFNAYIACGTVTGPGAITQRMAIGAQQEVGGRVSAVLVLQLTATSG